MSELRILGNELNGYVVQRLILGMWVDLTVRFKTYDEALRAYNEVTKLDDIDEESNA